MNLSLDKEYKCRNGWEAHIRDRSEATVGTFYFLGEINSQICGWWINCTWNEDGQSWYGPQLDLVEESNG